MMTTNLTKHASIYRANRINAIIDTVGIGEILFSLDSRDNTDICFTSTGVVVVKSKNTNKIITTYIASLSKAKDLYYKKFNLSRLPQWLYNVVRDNQKYADRINNADFV